MLMWACIIVSLSMVAGQSLLFAQTRSNIDLSIKEISKVMSERDPSGRNHNTKVIISPHQPLLNISEWRLLLHLNTEAVQTLTLAVDASRPSEQTEFIFEGNLIDSDSVFLQAISGSEVVATSFYSMTIRDLHSNVAWVGNDKMSPTSLRVVAAIDVSVVSVNEQNCTSAVSPCYFIKPDPKPASIKRCVSFYFGTQRTVKMCDERETSFFEIYPVPTLFLNKNDQMEVGLSFNPNASRVEVVAFHPEDHIQVFSNSSYQCLLAQSRSFSAGDRVTCLHNLTLPEGQERMRVLVVRTDEDGYVYDSSIQLFEGNSSDKYRTGVIVGSVVGGLVGLGLIVTLVILFVWRRKSKKKNKKKKPESSVAYTKAATTSNES